MVVLAVPVKVAQVGEGKSAPATAALRATGLGTHVTRLAVSAICRVRTYLVVACRPGLTLVAQGSHLFFALFRHVFWYRFKYTPTHASLMPARAIPSRIEVASLLVPNVPALIRHG